MGRKSTTCIGKKSGEPLTEYDSLKEAREGANYANRKYQSNLVPYECRECGKWHLSPSDRQTPSEKCPFCKGTNGLPKDAYLNRKDAQRRADILYEEQGVSLQVYRCDHSNAWHLTRDVRS